MMPRRAWLAALLILGWATGGCTSAGSTVPSTAATPTPTASAGSDPADARTPLEKLLAAGPNAKSPIYHFTVKSAGDPRSGVVDRHDQIVEYAWTQHYSNPSHTEITTTLLAGKKAWTRVTFVPAIRARTAGVPLKWMFLDPRKLASRGITGMVYSPDFDETGISAMYNSVSDVRETSPGHFVGVTDLSITADQEFLTPEQFKALGSKANHLHFTAVLDSHGRLHTMTIQMPGAGKVEASTYLATFDEYGTVAVPKLPTAADQTPAPSFVYDWFR